MKVNHTVALKPQPKLTALMEEFNQTKSLCMELLKTKHYQQMGETGIFAIVQKANSLSINPMDALNGGMYFVQGKVELSAIMMAKLIRAKGHSITLDKNSNNDICILHGKRKDNGDTWKVSFSIEDAKRAGIYKQGGPWNKYPDTMCYNRALSKIARQLFPDVIGNCYIEGEISDAPPLYDTPETTVIEEKEELLHIEENTVSLSKDDVQEIDELIGEDEERRENIFSLIKDRYHVTQLDQLKLEQKEVLCNGIRRSNQRKLQEVSA
jgi:hypothetical protein